MYLVRKLWNVFRYLKQAWGSVETKRNLWNREYAAGRWTHSEYTPGDYIYAFLVRYCHNGSILDLGCGSGNTGNELHPAGYKQYTGVDISEVALQKAILRSLANGRGAKNRYVKGDILNYVPDRRYDIILFRESIYYIPRLKIKSMLRRYARYLTEHGVFIVALGGTRTEKAWRILDIIKDHFAFLELECPIESKSCVAVFKGTGSEKGDKYPSLSVSKAGLVVMGWFLSGSESLAHVGMVF